MQLFNKGVFLVPVLGAMCLICGADAAPAVKQLGVSVAGNNAGVKTTVLPTKSASTGRIGSIRTTKMGAVKPVTTNKATTTTISNDAEKRLSIGKYLHNSGVNSGVIKPVMSTEAVAAASNDIVSLSDRVADVEIKVDNKQDVLTSENVTYSGEGAIVTSIVANNGSIVVGRDEVTIPVGAPGSSNRAEIWIE